MSIKLENINKVGEISRYLVINVNIYVVTVDTTEVVRTSSLPQHLQALEKFLQFLSYERHRFQSRYWHTDIKDENLELAIINPKLTMEAVIEQLESDVDSYKSQPGDYKYQVTIFSYMPPSRAFTPRNWGFTYQEVMNIEKRTKDDSRYFIHPFLPVKRLTAEEYMDMVSNKKERF